MQGSSRMHKLSGGGSTTLQSSWTWCRMCSRMTWQTMLMLVPPHQHQAVCLALHLQGVCLSWISSHYFVCITFCT